MASTRNNNTPGNYDLEQKKYYSTRNYETFANSQYGTAYNPALFSLGSNPSHMPRETFSSNPVDVESTLFGINSTNLVSPQKPVNPELKTIPTVCLFEKVPLLMPNPLVIENKQRPYFLN
jgi:hypothetical protein